MAQPTLPERISELRSRLPQIKAAARGQPGDVSPAYAHALKRLERWEAGDERPVIVNRLSDGRLFAQAITGDYQDGQIIDARAFNRGKTS